MVTKLVEVWEWFDFACGQRLVAALRTEVPRLRASGQLQCSDEVAAKLMKISASTIDRLLKREKQIQRVNRPRSTRMHPLLYQKIPVKVAAEWDTDEVGNVQVDYVEHCGRSSGGQFLFIRSVGRSISRRVRWFQTTISSNEPSGCARKTMANFA